ncbi:MAG: hypothetical protein U9N39_01665 [Campylobacterota bacterium]|nr:hypothetical protein [Campylobacterota bacterium]
MQLTIDVKDSALEKIMYFLNHLKADVKIISKVDTNELNIEKVSTTDDDFKFIADGREERKKNPENYGRFEDIDWN